MNREVSLPACVTVEQVARVLGFARHAIPVLVRAGLLKPVGDARGNAVKYFARDTLLARSHDERWLAEAVDAIRAHWKIKNQRRRRRAASTSPSRKEIDHDT